MFSPPQTKGCGPTIGLAAGAGLALTTLCSGPNYEKLRRFLAGQSPGQLQPGLGAIQATNHLNPNRPGS